MNSEISPIPFAAQGYKTQTVLLFTQNRRIPILPDVICTKVNVTNPTVSPIFQTGPLPITPPDDNYLNIYRNYHFGIIIYPPEYSSYFTTHLFLYFLIDFFSLSFLNTLWNISQFRMLQYLNCKRIFCKCRCLKKLHLLCRIYEDGKSYFIYISVIIHLLGK